MRDLLAFAFMWAVLLAWFCLLSPAYAADGLVDDRSLFFGMVTTLGIGIGIYLIVGAVGEAIHRKHKPLPDKPRGGTSDPVLWRIMQDDVHRYMERQKAEDRRGPS